MITMLTLEPTMLTLGPGLRDTLERTVPTFCDIFSEL